MSNSVSDHSDPQEGRVSGCVQCPVCLDDTIVNPTFPFDCGHSVCSKCDKELFCRADDRCPMCRNARLWESVDAHCADINSSNDMQRREDAIAQRHDEATARPGVLFFPVHPMAEVDATDFIVSQSRLVSEGAGVLHNPPVLQSLGRNGDSSSVSSAIGALVNAANVPLPGFHVIVASLRSSPYSRRQHVRATHRREGDRSATAGSVGYLLRF